MVVNLFHQSNLIWGRDTDRYRLAFTWYQFRCCCDVDPIHFINWISKNFCFMLQTVIWWDLVCVDRRTCRRNSTRGSWPHRGGVVDRPPRRSVLLRPRPPISTVRWLDCRPWRAGLVVSWATRTCRTRWGSGPSACRTPCTRRASPAWDCCHPVSESSGPVRRARMRSRRITTAATRWEPEEARTSRTWDCRGCHNCIRRSRSCSTRCSSTSCTHRV